MKRLFKKMLTVISAGIIAATANLSAFATETVNYDDKFWMVEYVTGKKVIYSDEDLYVTEDGEVRELTGSTISVGYIVPANTEELTLEKLGLSSEEYKLTKGGWTVLEGAVEYQIKVSTLEEADALYEKAMEIADTGVFVNAYKRCMYSYGCGIYGGKSFNKFTLNLKNKDEEFDFSCIENYEDLEIVKADSEDYNEYYIYYSDGIEYINIKKAQDAIESNENVESFDEGMGFCAVLHMESDTEYMYEETIVPYYVFMTLAGDIDLNDDTSISDIVALTKYNVNPELYAITNKNALGNADINKDNIIDSIDTNILIEMMFGDYESAF